MKNIFQVILLTILSQITMAQNEFNYEESKVPEYTLPKILDKNENLETWENSKRTETLQLFETHVYGKADLSGMSTQFEIINFEENALEGKAQKKEIKCTLSKNGKSHSFNILLFTPKNKTKSPIFLGLNFYGNHTIHSDPNITISKSWVPNHKEFEITNNTADEKSRGKRAYRWPVESMIARGYGLAAIYCGDLDPDFDDNFENGINSILNNQQISTLSAWAIGLSKAMDYFEQDETVDATNVAVFGHSRLGKAALWASAQDSRFKLTISNESGCGGAALSRRKFGETVERINDHFPHWFNPQFKTYGNNEENLPIDQHQLLALIAPRALYVASAEGDQWSDPRGEYLSLYEAGKLYQLYGNDEIPSKSPALNHSQQIGKIAYHIREGKHEVMLLDWRHYMDFADKILK